VISYSKKVTLRDCGLIEACRKRFYPGVVLIGKKMLGVTRNEERRNKK